MIVENDSDEKIKNESNEQIKSTAYVVIRILYY